MKKGSSVTLTRDEVIKYVINAYSKTLKDNVELFMQGNNEIVKMFENFKNMGGMYDHDLMNRWCDMCSELYFSQHPDIDEVLLDTTKLIDKDKGAMVEKCWMASREDVVLS